MTKSRLDRVGADTDTMIEMTVGPLIAAALLTSALYMTGCSLWLRAFLPRPRGFCFMLVPRSAR